jgi:hypothetical protein
MFAETTAMSFDVQKYVCPPPFCESNYMKKCSFFFVSIRRYARCCEKVPRGHIHEIAKGTHPRARAYMRRNDRGKVRTQ